MRSYQFRDFPSLWSEPKAVLIHLLDPPRTTNVEVSLRPLNIDYKVNKPTLTFDATITWDSAVIRFPITIKRYEVWVNTFETSRNQVEGAVEFAVREF